MDRDHVFDDHGYAEPGAGLGARACNGCVHARLHGNVDSRQRFLGYIAGWQGTHISLISAAIGTAVCQY